MQGEIMERGKAARRQAILLLAASSNAGGDRKTSAGKAAEQCGPPPNSTSGKLQPPGGSAAVARRRRGGRSRTERLQDSFALRIELLGFKRQSRPGPCHVGQDGAHPQVRRAISHLSAFDGTLSALDRSNHRHPAGHAHRPRLFVATIRQLQPVSPHATRSE